MVDGPASGFDVDGLQQQLDDFLKHVHRETRVPGLSAALSIEGRRIRSSTGIVALDRNEPLTDETEFHLGCITKLLVSIAALELARREQLDLAAPIQAYLPELRGSVHGQTIGLAHLLSHTSGYRGTSILDADTLSMDWNGLVEYLRSAPQHFAPGTVFSYEHTETVIAGEIIRRVTGKGGIEHVRKTIYEPLGIDPGTLSEGADVGRRAGQHVLDPSTRQFKPVKWSDLTVDGEAGISPMWEAAFSKHALPLGALLTIAEHVMGQSRPFPTVGAPPLAPATLSLLQRPAVSLTPMVSGPLSEIMPATFGLGAAHWRDGFCGIAGSTYGQCQGFRFDARIGVAVAVGVNAQQRYLRDLVMGRVCEALGAERDTPPQVPMNFRLHEVTGEYHGARNQRVTASVDDDRLVLIFDNEASPLKLRAELTRDEDGAAVLHSPVPELSLGFFRTVDGDGLGLMVGTTAYKRVNDRIQG